MNDLEFSFEPGPWEVFRMTLTMGDTVSASQILTLLEGEDGQVLEDNLRWCGKDREWLERTAQANTLLPEEILLLIGSETEDYFLLKKEDRHGSGPR